MSNLTDPEIIPLWPGGAPGTEDWPQQESEMLLPLFNQPYIVRNVTQPTLMAYLPTDHWIDRFYEWLQAQGFLA